MSWERRFARRTARMRPSAIREILKLTQRSDVISLAGGLPASEMFPVAEVAEAAARAMATNGVRALQYGPTDGLPELREWVAASLPGADADRVLITSGSQQGLDLLAKVLIDPGDGVAVGAPTYMGALRAFDPYEPTYLTVELDEEGMVPASLDEVLAGGPKFLYVIPDFDNPLGRRMSLARRRALLEIADRHDVLVIEDAPYRELRFDETVLPTLFELAPERVVHAGTLSKTLAPGLRLAWLVMPAPLAPVVERAKQAADLHTGTFAQSVAMELLATGALEARLPRLREHYRGQRDALADALDRELDGDLRFTRPPGGMFLWAELPLGVDATRLLAVAVEHGVAFVPGEPFFANGGPTNTMRLSYSLPSPATLATAATRLSAALAAVRQPA